MHVVSGACARRSYGNGFIGVIDFLGFVRQITVSALRTRVHVVSGACARRSYCNDFIVVFGWIEYIRCVRISAYLTSISVIAVSGTSRMRCYNVKGMIAVIARLPFDSFAYRANAVEESVLAVNVSVTAEVDPLAEGMYVFFLFGHFNSLSRSVGECNQKITAFVKLNLFNTYALGTCRTLLTGITLIALYITEIYDNAVVHYEHESAAICESDACNSVAVITYNLSRSNNAAVRISDNQLAAFIYLGLDDGHAVLTVCAIYAVFTLVALISLNVSKVDNSSVRESDYQIRAVQSNVLNTNAVSTVLTVRAVSTIFSVFAISAILTVSAYNLTNVHGRTVGERKYQLATFIYLGLDDRHAVLTVSSVCSCRTDHYACVNDRAV